MINHHLDDATILAHAAGTLNEALSTAVAAHAAWCPQCRSAIRRAEAMGGTLLMEIDAAPISAECRARTLAGLDQGTLHRFPAPARAAATDLPRPLARLMGDMALADVPWRNRAPGIGLYDIKLPQPAKGHLWLMRIAPGKSMPQHGHGGEEITMILSGAYHDEIGRFARGDVADLNDEVVHRPVVEEVEACVCLVATEAPTRFTSVFARLMQPLVGI